MPENELRCVVAGSFQKAKNEIDKAIDEFTDLGVKVLAPEKGWLYISPTKIYRPRDFYFRPLPSEKHLSIKQIEDGFLKAISNSDFMYVINPDGYVGSTVSFEIGFAIWNGILIYTKNQMNPSLDLDPIWAEKVRNYMTVATPEEIISSLAKSGH